MYRCTKQAENLSLENKDEDIWGIESRMINSLYMCFRSFSLGALTCFPRSQIEVFQQSNMQTQRNPMEIPLQFIRAFTITLKFDHL